MSGGTAPIGAKTNVTSSQQIQGENLNYVYLKAKFSEFPSNFSRVIVSVETHDQGWASVPGSESYFDLKIVDKNGTLLAEKSRIIENYSEKQFSKKTYTLNRNDQQLGSFMVGENMLQLIARSQYPGWQNHVKSGEIKFE